MCTFFIFAACRYDKGEWSKCVNGSMSRKDDVRAGSDASCKPTRDITKPCNKDKKQKKNDKSNFIESIMAPSNGGCTLHNNYKFSIRFDYYYFQMDEKAMHKL